MKLFFQLLWQLALISVLTSAEFSFAETAAEAKKLETMHSQGLYNQLNETQQKAKYLQVSATRDALFFSQQAAMKYSHGSECQASCPFGCCDSSEGLMYEGGLFMVLNQQATQTAKDSVVSARQACVASNQISTTQKNCSAEVKPFDLTTPDPTWFDSNGKCKSSAPSECGVIAAMPGSKIFTDSSVNCKASGGCSSDFYSTYKANSDGSVTFSMNGRSIKLTMDSFKDAQSLVTAGVSRDYADSLAVRFQIEKSKLKLPQSATTPVAVENLSAQASAVTASTSAVVESSAQPVLGTHQSYGTIQQREVSSEKLTVNYHGERIHINTVNLFDAISARYKAKGDTFFSGE